MVLSEVISRLPLRGDPVALVPHRDTLIVTGSEDGANLVKAAEMALQQIGDTQSVSGRAICFRSGAWYAFMPPPESPAHEPFRELGLKGQWGIYDLQRLALQALEGEQTFIGIFEVKLWKETSRWFSYAVWGDGIPTWMPVAEKVYFFSERTGQKVIRGPWEWDAVQKVAGALMQPKDCVPARVFVDRFPTDDMLDEIERSLS